MASSKKSFGLGFLSGAVVGVGGLLGFQNRSKIAGMFKRNKPLNDEKKK